MISLVAATEWNTKGVSSMVSGDYEAALLSFRQALDVARLVAPNATIPYSQAQAFCLEEVQCESIDTQASCTVFDKCFNILVNEVFSGNPTKSQVDFVIAIVLYNVGLACQLEGQRQSLQKVMYCEKAMRIYSMSATVAQGIGATQENFAVLLATANNMACLSLEKFDFESFYCYREWMGCLIISNKQFHNVFFSSNFAASHNVQERPAPAA